LSSGWLFSILDDASEKTFLCGTAVLIQKYIFDGGAGKIGLETKNIVACTSFVVEQKLVSFFPFLSFVWAQLLPKFQLSLSIPVLWCCIHQSCSLNTVALSNVLVCFVLAICDSLYSD
jgi:hypothetical protein